MKNILLSPTALFTVWTSAQAQPSVNLGPNMLTCGDSCVTVGPDASLVANGYLWNTGDTTRNIVFCMTGGITDTDLVLFAFDTLGNIGSDTITLTVVSCNDSVWPGDANNDGICNVYDISRIGQGFGFSGLARPGASTTWIGQPATNWAGSAVLDYKYADCDGNGTIQYADFQVVQLNYGLTHAKNGEPVGRSSGNPVLKISCQQDALLTGDTITFSIDLGNASLPVSNFYSIAFTMNVNTDLLQTDVSISNYDSNFVGNIGQTVYAFDTTVWGASLFEMGLTRYDHLNVSGYGNLAKVSYILIDDIAGKLQDIDITVPLEISFTNVVATSEDGTLIPLDVVGDTVIVKQGLASGIGNLGEWFSNIKLYPNPAANVVTIEVPNYIQATYIEVYNSLGALVSNEILNNVNRTQLDTKDLANGHYMVRLMTNEGWVMKKFSITR